ncbi:hypothetical protein ABTQ33_00235 [Paucilactobacillus suebicus]|uniref:Uncharacterized protein n=1 Tax=Paucilactobacillus suebicus DSM 5007 = KCTC 3549 TaxID=1423807 RepID=A0A0R1W4T0_9LACO|nr:hypothetical protein [Paucilactobacillus suebicus]KRM12605.1 hypothetical protein FD16_GL002118 [Paucilactobacillus suebicus DSM 5007 = KCTC 3549]
MNNQNSVTKYKLKKYRGILMATVADILVQHGDAFGDHVIGSRVNDCSLCKQYVELNVEMNQLDRTIVRSDDSESIDDERSNHIYFYVCHNIEGKDYIIRARNVGEVKGFLQSHLQNGLAVYNNSVHPIKVNKKTAYGLVHMYEGQIAKNKIKLLKESNDFRGILSQRDSVDETIR